MTYLEDLLDAPNFTLETSRLGKDFRARHKLPLLYQLGVVVKDIESCAARIETRGIGPFFIAQGKAASWRERGRDATPVARLGMASHLGVQIELIEPIEDADFYADWLDEKGRMVVHHLGFVVDDVDRHAGVLEKQGYPTWVRGSIRNLGLAIDFAYMDTIADAGIVIEFISMRCLGIPMVAPPALYQALGALECLTGVRCLKL